MSNRAHIPLKERLAAALCQMLRADESGKLVPAIPYEHAKLMTADQVLSLFHFDHYPIRKVDGGPDRHFNLVPHFIPAHREKTAKVDIPQNAKRKRIAPAIERHRAFMLSKAGQGEPPPAPRSRWPKRKLQSRNTFRRVP